MEWLIYVWLGVTALALILEFVTNEMISVWCAGGGLVAMVFAACKLPYWAQIIAFVVVTFVLLLCFRKMALKWLTKDKAKTNAEAVIGKEYKLITAIGFNQCGTIKIGDVIWSVTTESGEDSIAEGALVKIEKIEGNKYIVKEIK